MSTRCLLKLMTLLVTTAAGCAEAPEHPGYAADVLPIVQSRCMRCHGELRPAIPVAAGAEGVFRSFRLDIYEDDRAAGLMGAKSMALMMKSAVELPSDDPLRMPPAPALPLVGLQKDTISSWAPNPLP